MARISRVRLGWTLAIITAALFGSGACGAQARPSQGDTTKLNDTYKDHTDAVLSVAVNPAAPNEFVTGGRDKSPERDRPLMRVWDFAAGRQAYTITYLYGDPIAMSYSSDGRYLLVAQDNYWDKEQGCIRYVARLTIYDARRGRVIKNLDRGEYNAPIGCSFSPDGKLFTLAGMNKNIEIWTMDADIDKIAHKRLLLGHASHVPSTAWAPDSTRFASASMDGTVKIWDVNKIVEPCLKTLAGHTHSVNSVAWSADGTFVASGSSDKTVKIWDVNTGVAKTCEGHAEAVTCVAISPNNRVVVSGSMDRTIKVWDAASGKLLQTLTGHEGPVESIAISSDGKVLVSVSQDKTVKSWVMGKYANAGK